VDGLVLPQSLLVPPEHATSPTFGFWLDIDLLIPLFGGDLDGDGDGDPTSPNGPYQTFFYADLMRHAHLCTPRVVRVDDCPGPY